jgi:hypothetical protein
VCPEEQSVASQLWQSTWRKLVSIPAPQPRHAHAMRNEI